LVVERPVVFLGTSSVASDIGVSLEFVSNAWESLLARREAAVKSPVKIAKKARNLGNS
jgi:hypothetical protein